MAQNLNQNKTFPLNKVFSSHSYSTCMPISSFTGISKTSMTASNLTIWRYLPILTKIPKAYICIIDTALLYFTFMQVK